MKTVMESLGSVLVSETARLTEFLLLLAVLCFGYVGAYACLEMLRYFNHWVLTALAAKGPKDSGN